MTRFNPATNTPDWGGNTNRGPARWERASRNALRHPNSAAAKMYRSRYELALIVSDARKAMGDKDGPWQFIGPRYDAKRRGTKRTRLYATCSTFCTVMQVQLDFGKRDLEGVAQAFAVKPDENRPYLRTVERLDVKTLKRQTSCFVCTRKIGRKR